MVKRLLLGLILGLVVGSLVAAVLVKGLGMAVFTPFFAYVFAAVTGVLTGLVAGKPIWAKGAQIEAGLKAIFGAALASAGMWAVRRWLGMEIDLGAIGAGAGPLGELPATSLPIIAAVLAGLYEIDNTPEPADTTKGGGKGGGASKPSANVRVKTDDEEEAASDEDEAPARRAKR